MEVVCGLLNSAISRDLEYFQTYLKFVVAAVPSVARDARFGCDYYVSCLHVHSRIRFFTEIANFCFLHVIAHTDDIRRGTVFNFYCLFSVYPYAI